MIFNWYKIANLTAFLATGLVSRTIDVALEDIGQKSVLITRGNLLSMTVDDVMLSVQMNGRNPFTFEGRGIYLDGNNDLWYGVEVEA